MHAIIRNGCGNAEHQRRVVAKSPAVLKSHDELRRIPVIILSSSNSKKDVTSCYNLGANCYIVKPVELEAYRGLVQRLEDFWLGAAELPHREGHSMATRIGFEQQGVTLRPEHSYRITQ